MIVFQLYPNIGLATKSLGSRCISELNCKSISTLTLPIASNAFASVAEKTLKDLTATLIMINNKVFYPCLNSQGVGCQIV